MASVIFNNTGTTDELQLLAPVGANEHIRIHTIHVSSSCQVGVGVNLYQSEGAADGFIAFRLPPNGDAQRIYTTGFYSIPAAGLFVQGGDGVTGGFSVDVEYTVEAES